MTSKKKYTLGITCIIILSFTLIYGSFALAAPPTSRSCPSRAETTRIIIEEFDFLIHPSQTEPFVDVDENDWFAEYIASAFNNRLIFDDLRHQFFPNQKTTGDWLNDVLKRAITITYERQCPQVNKAMVIKKIFQARGVKNLPDFPNSSSCETIDFTTWYGQYLAQAVDEGWINCSTTAEGWHINESVNRAEFTKYISVSNDLLDDFDPPSTPTYFDVPPGTWFYPHVEAAVYYDLIDPDPNNLYFEPAEIADQCFMDSMLSRI
ncbi:hypothetical protein ACFL2V_09400 [Pseudomonadota bacterium]